jgi:DNA-binding response OmpR family regulator
MIYRLLLVEDDRALARGLTDNFRDEGYQVRVVRRGTDAMPAVREFCPHLLVLDIMLPGRSGLEILKELRARGNSVPILMLTAKGDILDRVVGFEMGADDYLPKPFAVRELLARVKALLRRSSAPGQESTDLKEVVVGEIRFDFLAFTAVGSEGTLDLTAHDILVMKVLAGRRGEVVPRIDIVEEVCGMDSDATLRTIDNHIVALRRAVGDDPHRPRWLHTVRGEGYRLAMADNH